SDRLRDLFAEPYDRAALEAAALALALRRNETDLATLLGREPRPVRYVVSIDARRLPIEEMQSERQRQPAIEFKLDVDPSWDDRALERLADFGSIAVLDFKGRGDGRDHERFARRFPDALLEDALAPETLAKTLPPESVSAGTPVSPLVRSRLSLDAPLLPGLRLADLAELPAAVNVKPARLGGVLAAIELACEATRLGR